MLKFGRILVAAAVLAPLSVAGTIITVTSPGALGATDFVDWGQLGPDFTDVPAPFVAISNLGMNVSVGSAGQDFASIQQGNSWGGNFTPGDNLLYLQGTGAYSITFASAIQAAGMQFQSNGFGSLVASITAFGAGNVNFGTVSLSGTSNGNADGSALFLGVHSSLNDIVSMTVNVQLSGVDTDFAVNRMLIETSSSGTATPEPSTMGMAGAVLLLAAWRVHRSCSRL